MKILFLWQWENTLDVIARFDEGIGEIWRLFAKDGHDVTITTYGGPASGIDHGIKFLLVPRETPFPQWASKVKDLCPDVIYCWGSIDHKIAKFCKELMPEVPLLFFLAGGGVDHPHTSLYDHFFVETKFHKKDLNDHGKPATEALGVMVDQLVIKPNQPKLWDVLLPASFTSNKRYSLFADVVEIGHLRAVAVGPKNDEGCLIECEKVEIPTFGYVTRSSLCDFYNASRVTVLTGGAWGGSQRTLLESLACGTPVVACEDNFQLDFFTGADSPVVFCPPQPEFILDAVRRVIASPAKPQMLRDYVLSRFTAHHYYDLVKQETERILFERTVSNV